jgi:hypothetical protein
MHLCLPSSNLCTIVVIEHPTFKLLNLKFSFKTSPFYFQQLYFSNKKFNDVEILCEDVLSINLTSFRFLNKSIVVVKRS